MKTMLVETIDTVRRIQNGFELSGSGATIRVAQVQDRVVRLRAACDGRFRDESAFVLADGQPSSFPARCKELGGTVRLGSRAMTVTAGLRPFRLEFADARRACFLSTPPGTGLEWRSGKALQRFALPAGIRVHGLGQGTSRTLDLRDQERRMWNQWDGFRYNGNAGIPFLLTSAGYGVLLNSSWASRFVIGQGHPQPCTRQAKPAGPWGPDEPSGETILVEGGDLDLFIIYGPAPARILQGCQELTGHAPLPPIWALGWLQSKNRYKTQEELLEIGREYRRRGIPGDALIIDWCWSEHFGDLEWVKSSWPDPTAMARELKALGFRVLQAQHPFMHSGSPHFRDFDEKGYLVSWDPSKVSDGWPPDGIRHVVDFSHPGARVLWWRKVEPLFRQGIDGYWTDMGEPDTHPPDCSPHHLGPREQVHNIYSTLWSKALYDGQRSVSNQRVFCLARAVFAGIQRYGTALWSGDVEPSWEVLQDLCTTTQVLQNLSQRREETAVG